MKILNPTTAMDFYKADHISQYPKGSNKVYSNFTPRSARLFNGSFLYDNKVMNFGIQRVVQYLFLELWQEEFFDAPKEKAIQRYKRRMDNALGEGAVKISHLEALYELGYLPLHMKAIDEGVRTPIKVPTFTLTNSAGHSDFFWVVNYLESILSTESWKSITMATTAFEFRRVFEHFAEITGADKSFIQFQGHDFSMRGLSNSMDAYHNSIAHLGSFTGTDTVLAIDGAEDYYGADSGRELVGTSVYASEHSTITMSIASWIREHRKEVCVIASEMPVVQEDGIHPGWENTDWQRDIDDCLRDGFKIIKTPSTYYRILASFEVQPISEEEAISNSRMTMDSLQDRQEAEYHVLKHMITKVYPTGIYSHVSDSYDYWHTISVTVPRLKEEILARKVNALGLAKLTLRPDSGDPEKIICGLEIKDLANYLTEGDDERPFSQIINLANNMINTTHYDGFFFQGKNYDFKGQELSDNVIKGSLNILWDIFGGVKNDKGLKVLNPRIGLIYGDSITIDRQFKILSKMKDMGFDSSNIILGIGSYSYQYMTRDTLGFAMKATYGETHGHPIEIFKDPKTDSGTKKSAKGLLYVGLVDGEYVLEDQVSIEREADSTNQLKTIFLNGSMKKKVTLQEIRTRIDNEFKAKVI